MRDDILRSPSQREADQMLSRPVEHWIAERRVAGASYDAIARDLFAETCGQLDISPNTLRGWSEATGAALPANLTRTDLDRLHSAGGC